jgi:nitrate reductase NapE
VLCAPISVCDDQENGMQPQAQQPAPGTAPASSTRGELIAFLLLAVVVWPALTVGVVGGFGFVVWMQQQIFGPPHAVSVSHAS